MYNKILLTTVLVFCTTVSITAQRTVYQQMTDFNRIINDCIMNDMMNKNMCDEWRRKGEKIPSMCSKYDSSGSSSGRVGAAAATPKKGLVKFSPVAGDTSFQQFANDNGSTAAEKQLMLQIAASTKALFEERYASRGLKNNVAGAFAFFIISNMTVYTGSEPSEVTQTALFETLDGIFSESQAFVAASNKEKQELYNTLIAYSGFPLTVYADGVQKGDSQQIEKARSLAAGYIKLILKIEPESLRPLLAIDPSNTLQDRTPEPRKDISPAASSSLNAKYSCLKLASRNGSTVHDPAGLGLTIRDGSYSPVSGSGGKVSISGNTATFSGGVLNGYRGEIRSSDTKRYILFRTKFTEIRLNESARYGDIQCYPQ